MFESVPRTLVAIILFVTIGVAAVPDTVSSAGPSWHPSPTVVITGANRGLGLEFARQFAAVGANVIGTARRPEAAKELRALRVRIEKLDVADSGSVERLAKQLEDQPVDILINNAGIGSRLIKLEDVDVDAIDRYFQVNVLGPMRVTKSLMRSLRKGDRKLVVNITSNLASMALNTTGGAYGYRESKAALNMFTRTLAAELRMEGFTCVVISPGWVRTDMGGHLAPLSPAESISGIIELMHGLNPEHTGRFLNYLGKEIPW